MFLRTGPDKRLDADEAAYSSATGQARTIDGIASISENIFTYKHLDKRKSSKLFILAAKKSLIIVMNRLVFFFSMLFELEHLKK